MPAATTAASAAKVGGDGNGHATAALPGGAIACRSRSETAALSPCSTDTRLATLPAAAREGRRIYGIGSVATGIATAGSAISTATLNSTVAGLSSATTTAARHDHARTNGIAAQPEVRGLAAVAPCSGLGIGHTAQATIALTAHKDEQRLPDCSGQGTCGRATQAAGAARTRNEGPIIALRSECLNGYLVDPSGHHIRLLSSGVRVILRGGAGLAKGLCHCTAHPGNTCDSDEACTRHLPRRVGRLTATTARKFV